MTQIKKKRSSRLGIEPTNQTAEKTWGIYTRLEPTLAVRSEPARGRQSPTTWPRIRRGGSLKPVQPGHVELVPAYNLANPHRGSSFPPFCYSHRSPETQPSGARGAKCYRSIKSTFVQSTASTTSPQAKDEANELANNAGVGQRTREVGGRTRPWKTRMT